MWWLISSLRSLLNCFLSWSCVTVCSSVLVRVSTFCSVVVIFVVTLLIVTSNVGYFGAGCFVPIICFRCFHESLMFSVNSSLLHLFSQFSLFSIFISLFISLLYRVFCSMVFVFFAIFPYVFFVLNHVSCGSPIWFSFIVLVWVESCGDGVYLYIG